MLALYAKRQSICLLLFWNCLSNHCLTGWPEHYEAIMMQKSELVSMSLCCPQSYIPWPSSRNSVMVAEVHLDHGLDASMLVRIEDIKRLSSVEPKFSSQNLESSWERPSRCPGEEKRECKWYEEERNFRLQMILKFWFYLTIHYPPHLQLFFWHLINGDFNSLHIQTDPRGIWKLHDVMK